MVNEVASLLMVVRLEEPNLPAASASPSSFSP